jgi:hypothetical protein
MEMRTGLFPSDPVAFVALMRSPPPRVESAAEFAKRCKTDPMLSALVERQERLARDEQRVQLANTLNSILAADLAHEMKRAHGTDSTRQSYRTDFRRYQKWCAGEGLAAFPAAPETIAAYLLHLAADVRPERLNRAVAVIKYYHEQADVPFHDGIEIRAVLRFVKRCHEQQKEIDRKAAVTAMPEPVTN